MWNVYGFTVLFYSCGGSVLNIVSIESGLSVELSNEEQMVDGMERRPPIEIGLAGVSTL